MNFKTTLTKFSQSINWNGIFYATYKIIFTSLSFLLFTYLTTQDFSTWANINSIIFLLLLWIDFGLRKSIPRYMPIFAQNQTSHKRFIKYLLLFQIGVLVLTIPLCLFLIIKLGTLLQLQQQGSLLSIGAGIFATEGMINVMRLIYHAHFWNKQFNILNTVALCGEMIANLFILITVKESSLILKSIFVTKLMSGAFINAVSIIMLTMLYKDKNYLENKYVDFIQTFKSFIKHSLIMWVNNNLKSLSERNFLVPFFTYTLGTGIANLFKVANDGALFFYRIVLKTIGTTDTTLLAHVDTLPEGKKLLPIAFKKLCSKIAGLCFPLLGILFLLFLKGDQFFNEPFVFQTLFIMAICYLIEFIVSPYERILEIKRQYVILLYAYLPYILMIGLLLCSPLITSFGLIKAILIIHGVRLVSSILMLYFARNLYHLRYPIRYVSILVCVYGCIYIIILLLSFLLPSFLPFPFLSLHSYIRSLLLIR